MQKDEFTPPASTEGHRTRNQVLTCPNETREDPNLDGREIQLLSACYLAEGPSRWPLHCTPTFCSRTDAVEGFFGKLARRRFRCGSSPQAKEGFK